MVWTVAGGVPRSRLIGSAEAATNELHLRTDQRQPSGLRQAGQSERDGDVAGGAGRRRQVAEEAGIHDPYRRHHASFQAGAVRHRGAAMRRAPSCTLHTVPGEHDILEEDGKSYLNRFGKGTKGDGWYSFDADGVHFIGLVNVVNLQGNGLGALGHEQLEWLEDDVKHLTASTPIVVFAHVPLWIVYQDWGWGTSDGAQALSLPEEVRLGDGTERPHPPDDAEGGRQRGVPHRALHRVPAAGARHREEPRTDGGAGRRTEAATSASPASAWCRRRRRSPSSIRRSPAEGHTMNETFGAGRHRPAPAAAPCTRQRARGA